MSFKKRMKGLPVEHLGAKGLLYADWSALTVCQRECIARVGMTVQNEQEAYLSQHPEIKAMLDLFVSKMGQINRRNSNTVLAESGRYFTRPAEELDKEIRKLLELPPDGPYIRADKPPFRYKDLDLEVDLRNIIAKHYPPDPWVVTSPIVTTPDTLSSTFLSINTSDTTVPTPEPIPIPPPTISEVFLNLVSTTVDKAIYSRIDDRALRYDTAYVELTKVVEDAMEIPVLEIREDVAQLFYNAYQMFELLIMEKERIAAEIAWEKRMRKKLKRTMRRLKNFKGYETPPSPKSQISTHESYKKPPPKPCICHPQYHYNRYAKDRFGIYLARETTFCTKNTTTTPVVSADSSEDENGDKNDEDADTKSVVSKKSVLSTKSSRNNISKKEEKD